MSWSGGCQCGAVRFRVEGRLGLTLICHCRMCQKASGSAFGPYVSVNPNALVWTRGGRKRFQSSNKAARGFCADCGTPLTYERGGDVMSLAMGAFDRAHEIRPMVQMDTETAWPWVAEIHRLAVFDPASDPGYAAEMAEIVSYQHPDHDTEVWPAK